MYIWTLYIPRLFSLQPPVKQLLLLLSLLSSLPLSAAIAFFFYIKENFAKCKSGEKKPQQMWSKKRETKIDGWRVNHCSKHQVIKLFNYFTSTIVYGGDIGFKELGAEPTRWILLKQETILLLEIWIKYANNLQYTDFTNLTNGNNKCLFLVVPNSPLKIRVDLNLFVWFGRRPPSKLPTYLLVHHINVISQVIPTSIYPHNPRYL